ncbi:hypothetical protein GCM10027347_50400 [Larkinella harenae]
MELIYEPVWVGNGRMRLSWVWFAFNNEFLAKSPTLTMKRAFGEIRFEYSFIHEVQYMKQYFLYVY